MRKLGVDPDTIVGNHASSNDEMYNNDGDVEEELYEEEEEDDFEDFGGSDPFHRGPHQPQANRHPPNDRTPAEVPPSTQQPQHYRHYQQQQQHYHQSLQHHQQQPRVSSGASAEQQGDLLMTGDGLMDPEDPLCTPFTVVAVPASNANNTSSTTSSTSNVLEESLHARTVGRLRHLDILEEVN